MFGASNAKDFSRRLVIKAQLGDDLRRIPIHNEDLTYDEIAIMMQRVFKPRLEKDTDFIIKYKDEDNEFVTIADESDLSYAIQQCQDVLRLQIIVKGSAGDSCTNAVTSGSQSVDVAQLNSSDRRSLISELRRLRDHVNNLVDKLDNCMINSEVHLNAKQDNGVAVTEAETVGKNPEFDPLSASGLQNSVSATPKTSVAGDEVDPHKPSEEPPITAPAPALLSQFQQPPAPTAFQPVPPPMSSAPAPVASSASETMSQGRTSACAETAPVSAPAPPTSMAVPTLSQSPPAILPTTNIPPVGASVSQPMPTFTAYSSSQSQQPLFGQAGTQPPPPQQPPAFVSHMESAPPPMFARAGPPPPPSQQQQRFRGPPMSFGASQNSFASPPLSTGPPQMRAPEPSPFMPPCSMMRPGGPPPPPGPPLQMHPGSTQPPSASPIGGGLTLGGPPRYSMPGTNTPPPTSHMWPGDASSAVPPPPMMHHGGVPPPPMMQPTGAPPPPRPY